MPIKEGWEVSPEMHKEFEQMLRNYEVGDPILTSRCYVEGTRGFFVVGNKGFAWKDTQSSASTFVK